MMRERLLFLLALAFLATGCTRTIEIAANRQLPRYDDAPYARVLDVAVVDGLVDYSQITGEVEDDLNQYLDAVARFGPESTPDQFATRDDELAYYLNAYNALMIRLWLDEGAATADGDEGVNWGTWFITKGFRVDGDSTSLHSLEQGLIRPDYDEPRIHFALVCGALSCPPLLDEPFRGDRLDEQLDELGRRWLQEPDGLTIDDDGDVRLSRIFDWYRGDFDTMGGLAGVIERYLPEGERRDRAVAAARDGELDFQSYDWTINDPAALE
jgi:hypothetical protein